MSVIKKHWKVVLCVTLVVIVVTAAYLGWRYYQNTHVYEQYRGDGHVIGYEESADGLIVVLEVKENAYWISDRTENHVRFLIDDDTSAMYPNVIYVMKNRIVGFDISFVSREFWVPDAMADDNFIYPAFGFHISASEWYDMTETGIVNEAEYNEFTSEYKNKTGKSTLEWLCVGYCNEID